MNRIEENVEFRRRAMERDLAGWEARKKTANQLVHEWAENNVREHPSDRRAAGFCGCGSRLPCPRGHPRQ